MKIVQSVRAVMKILIAGTKKLKVQRTTDVFNETAFNFSMERMTYGDDRQMGVFTIQYLVSPNPTTASTAPSITYDEIITSFKENMPMAMKNEGLILISYAYSESDISTDPTDGSVSLAFSITINIVEKNNT